MLFNIRIARTYYCLTTSSFHRLKYVYDKKSYFVGTGSHFKRKLNTRVTSRSTSAAMVFFCNRETNTSITSLYFGRNRLL